MQRVTEQLEGQNLPARAGAVLAHADKTLATLDERLAQLDTRGLSQDSRAVLATWQGTAVRVNQMLDRVNGERGLMASAERVSDSLGVAAQNANGFSTELEHTLRDVSEAAAAVRELADALGRQPDMLVKGRGRINR